MYSKKKWQGPAINVHNYIKVEKQTVNKKLDDPIDLRWSDGDSSHPEGGIPSPEVDGETLKQVGGRVCRRVTKSLAL